MPITLAQAQVNTQADIDYAVIDNLRRYSWLLDQIVFDDTVTPGTAGGSLTYGYTRLTTAAPAAFRAINSEYTPGQATRTRYTVDLKPMGGSFSVDRVLKNLGAAATNEVTFQMQQLETSIRTRFAQELILGDTAVDANGYDGLSKLLVGSSTERTAVVADWTAATVITQPLAMARLDEVDEWLSSIVPSHTGGGDQGTPGALPPGTKAILGNTKSITRFKALARWAALYSMEQDSLGRKIERYGDWVLVDLGDRADGASPIIPVSSSSTDLYAVTFGLDSVHAASAAGQPIVQTWLPDFSTAGAVKTGEIEMGPAALVVKNTKAAGVLRGIDVV
ncbi:phage major capsid protein [Streptomyces sp. ISL-43]|uniref:major capsid protein n=1 Tax=Streptomyces sp. ISL-43 TaxID=2819183 RepID=UPI001BE7AC71|nr:phage major capsid protein [Streptomyces sp. ISL-43]MBT2449474.1 phage major capsid protein [Streptomyces sp. ISL-43]